MELIMYSFSHSGKDEQKGYTAKHEITRVTKGGVTACKN